jgi:hypothetical protein
MSCPQRVKVAPFSITLRSTVGKAVVSPLARHNKRLQRTGISVSHREKVAVGDESLYTAPRILSYAL